jgi:hypothetical protein
VVLTDVSGLPIGSIFKVPTDSPETSVSGTPCCKPEDGSIRPDRLWGPMNLLNKFPCMCLTTYPYLVPRLTVGGGTEPTSASANAFTVRTYVSVLRLSPWQLPERFLTFLSLPHSCRRALSLCRLWRVSQGWSLARLPDSLCAAGEQTHQTLINSA